MAEFNGIVEYHDGLAVSDYVNMIPLGSTCVDRIGDKVVRPPLSENDFAIRGTFVDSHHNIYIAYGSSLLRYFYDEYTGEISETPEVMKMLVDGELKDFTFFDQSHRVTFCESSLKPSEVFACDGKLIYVWTTYDGMTRPTYYKFRVNVVCPPNISRTSVEENGVQVNWASDVAQPDFNSIIFGTDTMYTVEGVQLREAFEDVRTDTIDWFDNRLIATQLNKNTVWLTRTDPMYYIRDESVHYLDADSPDTGGYELWPNWYSSSSSSDKLLTAKAYSGQLYFFNEHTIEIWGRTGNEDAPIQSNTQQVLHFGGDKPTIIEGVMYFVGIDAMNDHFIGAFSPQFSRVSNKEIERRLGSVDSMEKLSQYNETYLFVKNADGDGFVYGADKWWRWETPVGADYSVHSSLIKEYAVASDSSIIKFDDKVRLSGGKRINRAIRDGFVQLPKRAIIRRIELVADTGRTDVDSSIVDKRIDESLADKSVYCAISINRGLSFSKRRYRRLGETGHNDKVIEWRNLGSGNSLLVEIGTSSLHRLQVYDIKAEFE